MRRFPNLPRILLIAGAGLLLAVVLAGLVLRERGGHGRSTGTAAEPAPATTAPPRPTTTAPAPPPTTTAPPPATSAPPPAPAPQPASPSPSPVPMSWSNAGALIVDVTAANPEWLGRMMRSSGFGWVALPLGGPAPLTAPPPGWAERFEAASGLPVGGWSVLGADPAADAAAVAQVLKSRGLSFYVADAEAAYNGQPDRSQAFVQAFRALEPALPAALSSFCDAEGLGLGPWAKSGFDFLPQAYVNDFGAAVAPQACVRAAAAWFPRARVHPTVACYGGQQGYVPPTQFAQLLAQAGTRGFSVFPAETLVQPGDWKTYAHAIASLHIAAPVPPA